MTSQELLEKQRQYLWPNHILYYTEPIALDHGEGLYVWDADGNKYLDFFGGILTTSIGHNHPKVIAAVQEQTGKLIHSSTLYPNASPILLAEKLAELTPGKLQTSFFTNSGSEANEKAVGLAQTYTDNREIVALRHGYSGGTALTMSLAGQSTWKVGKSFSPSATYPSPYALA